MKKAYFVVFAGLMVACGGGGVSISNLDTEKPDSAIQDKAPDLDGDTFLDTVADAWQGDTTVDSGREVILVPCEPGEVCDDKDPCTINDECRENGYCRGTFVPACEDNLYCTDDSCTSADHCTHSLKPGFCLINGRCFKEGESPEDNPCVTCQTALATDTFLPDDTKPCDDKNLCTKDDKCRGGVCIGTPVICEDGNPCTKGACDPATGQCTFKPVEGTCSDGDLCTQNDKCVQGRCVGTPVSCDDGNPCTTDSCDSTVGCIHTPKADYEQCEDQNLCTIGDFCLQGKCVPGEGRLTCDDGNPCTTDNCVPTKGCVFIPNNDPCDDGNVCTIGDYCKAGKCESGTTLLQCDDQNPCTDDLCHPLQGCVFIPNHASCDDQDPCFLNDYCENGECKRGLLPLNCDDSNPCTADSCIEGIGCAYQNLDGILCDDGNFCTENDRCLDARCSGTPISCDDGNDCTIDYCDPNPQGGGCMHDPDMVKPECRPQINITYPPRGATLDGSRTITVRGTVTSRAGFITQVTFTFNGQTTPILPNPLDGSFSVQVTSSQGINLIVMDAQDQYGRKDHLVQSYYYSTKWYPIDPANPSNSYVKDGLMVFLGPEVWDDNDTSDVDDLATIMTLYIKNLDIGSLIHNPVTSGTFGWCDYKVNVYNIRYGNPSVDLTPVDGGLYVRAVIPNFYADVSIPTSGFACPDFSGHVTASSIVITTTLLISVDANGDPQVTATNTDVQINGLNVTIDGLWGFLLNWIIDFFENDFANQIENAFRSQLAGQLEGAVEDALKSLKLDQTIQIPPLMTGGSPVTLQLKTKFSTISFTTAGGVIGFYATMVTPKNISHNPLGSIGRAKCLQSGDEPFAFPMHGSLELALHDDFFNQIPFGLYYGGGLAFPVTAQQLGQDLSQYGITDLTLYIDFLLPPIVTSCTPQGKMWLEIGDISILADMKLFGMPVQALIYASAVMEAQIVAVQTEQGAQLGISVSSPVFLDLEIASLTGGLAGGEEALYSILKDQFMPMILQSFTGGAFGSFPIPSIPLSGMMPGLPPDASISMDLREVLRIFGYTVLSGRVK